MALSRIICLFHGHEFVVIGDTGVLPALSGRDVKNLLKLAGLVSSATGKPVTAEAINFVKKFKPTVDRQETP